MNARRNGDPARAAVGCAVRRAAATAASVCVVSAAVAARGVLAQPVPDRSLGAASIVLHPRRSTRDVPLVDGHDIRFRRLAAEGLSRTRVVEIAQDDVGLLWFRTQSGLRRYDGHELREFRREESRHDATGALYALIRDGASALWLGNDGTLDSFDARRETFAVHRVSTAGAAPKPVSVWCIHRDSSRVLWLCTREGLYRVDARAGQTTALRHRPGDPTSLADDAIQFVGEDRQGALWVGTPVGLDQLDRSSGQVVRHLPMDASPRGITAHEDRFGVFWIIAGAEGQLAAFDRGANTLVTWRPTSVDDAAGPVVFSAMLEDREGTMWFATLNHGILKLDRARHRLIRYASDPSNPHGLSDRHVNTLFQDREGVIWAGLHQSEPAYFLPHPPPFQSIHIAGRAPALVSGILADHAGTVWLGLDQGLRTFDRATWVYRDVPGFERDETTSIVEQGHGVFWVGTAGQGLRRYDARTGRTTTFRHDPRDATSLPSDFVEQVTLDRRGRPWAVTWRGLARWDSASRRFTIVLPAGAPPELTPHTATFARNGTLWIGSNVGVHRIDSVDSDRPTARWFRHVPGDASSLSGDRVNAIHEADDGSVWIGTPMGLDHWLTDATPVRHYGQEDGLPGSVVSCILEDESRHLWMSTDRGIARLDPASGAFRAYGTADGLPGANMTGWDACARAGSGEMFFAGFAGAVAFFPDRIVDRAYAPPVTLTRVRILDPTRDGRDARAPAPPAGLPDEITLRPSRRNVSVEFTALSFLSPETNRFRYRLRGLQDGWTEVRSDQRTATYMALPSGSYVFEVQGATGHGPWNPAAATLRIVVPPPWWATRPFYALAAVAVGAALALAYRVRVRQLTHAANVRHEARWAERTRIARELHDTLLQGFQGLMFRLQAVRDLLPEQASRAIPVLDTALLKGEEAIDDARRSVSDLRSWEKVDRDFEAGLAALAAGVAHSSRHESTPSWGLATRGRVREIPPAVLYELYRVAQEAISNSFRHARAEHVTVEVMYGADELRVTVADNGVGVDEAVLAADRTPGHFGVQGMRERVARLGGRLALHSRPREGTRVVLSLPRSVAYGETSTTDGALARPRWRARAGAARHD